MLYTEQQTEDQKGIRFESGAAATTVFEKRER